MPLVHFVLFKTTLRKTFWPYMKILSKNTSLLPPESMIPPFHILFTPLFHFLPLLVLFLSFLLHSFIFYYILLHFVSFCFISLHFVFISLHFVFILLHFVFISHNFASFRILVGPKRGAWRQGMGDAQNLNAPCIYGVRRTGLSRSAARTRVLLLVNGWT